jgi:hypothetical protein
MRIVKQLFVLTLVALVLESQLSAEVPGARLLASGSIMVNGHQAPDNTVLFDGDMVGVGASSRAIIQQQGFAAFLEPGTQVKYLQSDGKNSVEVLSGASTISLRNKSAGVVFRGLTAHPKTPEAKVVIGLEHGRPAMMASGGDLIVTSGTASMTLLNGSALVQVRQAPPLVLKRPPRRPILKRPNLRRPPKRPPLLRKRTTVAKKIRTKTKRDGRSAPEPNLNPGLRASM